MSDSIEDKEKFRLVVAVVIAMPLILQMLSDLAGGYGFISLGILIVSATMLQLAISSFYYELFVGLRHGKVSVEGLVAVATFALWAASIIMWIKNGPEGGAAFAAVNAIAVPAALYGRIISRQILSPLPKGRDDEFMMPRDARLKKANGVFEKVPLANIRQGDFIQVLAGEICPVDAAIVEGSGIFTSVEINGDPMPRYYSKGDNILAGSECFGSTIIVKAIRGGYESRLTDACSYARMVSRFEKTSRFVDRFLRPLAITTLLVSFFIGLAWVGLADPLEGLMIGLATFGISITAGFGLVSALPQFFGAEYLRTKGVLIHQPDIVETARKLNHLYVSPVDMFLMRKPKLANFHTDADENEVLSIIYGMLKSINHPLLGPVQLACDFRAIKPAKLRKVFFDPSRGITGEYNERLMLFGNPALLSSNGVGYHKFGNEVKEMEAKGETVYWLAEAKPERDCLAIFSFKPTVRSSANEAVERIKKEGISVDLLTQFSEQRHLKPLQELSFSSLVPATNSIQIYNSVVQAQAVDEVVAVSAMTAMDLPAVQAADMTIMSATGPAMLMSYATITLSNPDPDRLASAVLVSKAMGQRISSNVKIAIGFSALALAFGAFNLLSPYVANVFALVSISLIAANSYFVKTSE